MPPGFHLVEDTVGDPADQLPGHVSVIHIGEVGGDLPGRQPFGIQRQDRLVEPVQPAGVLGHDPRVERPCPVPRDLDPHRPDLGLHRLRTMTVTDVGPPARLLVDTGLVEVHIQLRVEC
ncbi:hypothetical protein GCM10027615_36920 [Plantactinospora veratri]